MDSVFCPENSVILTPEKIVQPVGELTVSLISFQLFIRSTLVSQFTSHITVDAILQLAGCLGDHFLHFRSGIQAGAFNDRLYRFFPLDSHDMHAGYAFNLLKLLD